MSLGWRKISFIVILLAGLASVCAYWQSQRIGELEALITSTTEDALHLKTELGFGGLIHNFKNYLIRSEEDQYRTGAYANAARAKELAAALEADAASLGLDISLTATKDMIASYEERLAIVQSLSDENASIREIDNAVRYNDEDAITEINKTLLSITEAANDKISNIILIGELQLLAIGLLGVSILFAAAISKRASRHAREIRAKNKTLTQSNEKLAEANHALQQFAGNASHDLRSPIGHIEFYANMIDNNADDENVKEYTDRLRDTANSMQTLVSSLLEFARAGFKEPNLETVNIRFLLLDTLEEREAEIEERKAKINIPSSPPSINADAELLRRVFHNLIGNSLKYARNDATPEIDISVEETGDETVFSITDNGIGIDAAYAEKIFEPMQRLHQQNGKYSGVGIGLALVKSIIESHGGKIWLDTSFTNGSKFVFSLPTQGVNQSAMKGTQSDRVAPPPVASARKVA